VTGNRAYPTTPSSSFRHHAGCLSHAKRRGRLSSSPPEWQRSLEMRRRPRHDGMPHVAYLACAPSGLRTSCLSGLRVWTQVPLVQTDWVQIPEASSGSPYRQQRTGVTTSVTSAIAPCMLSRSVWSVTQRAIWPDGQGVGFLIRRLRARLPQGAFI
jgi:hypothetical protein